MGTLRLEHGNHEMYFGEISDCNYINNNNIEKTIYSTGFETLGNSIVISIEFENSNKR